MEVKINREIRNYTEAMFFGLSLRQFIFSILACGVAVGIYFFAETVCRNGGRVMDVYFLELLRSLSLDLLNIME